MDFLFHVNLEWTTWKLNIWLDTERWVPLEDQLYVEVSEYGEQQWRKLGTEIIERSIDMW